MTAPPRENRAPAAPSRIFARSARSAASARSAFSSASRASSSSAASSSASAAAASKAARVAAAAASAAAARRVFAIFSARSASPISRATRFARAAATFAAARASGEGRPRAVSGTPGAARRQEAPPADAPAFGAEVGDAETSEKMFRSRNGAGVRGSRPSPASAAVTSLGSPYAPPRASTRGVTRRTRPRTRPRAGVFSKAFFFEEPFSKPASYAARMSKSTPHALFASPAARSAADHRCRGATRPARRNTASALLMLCVASAFTFGRRCVSPRCAPSSVSARRHRSAPLAISAWMPVARGRPTTTSPATAAPATSTPSPRTHTTASCCSGVSRETRAPPRPHACAESRGVGRNAASAGGGVPPLNPRRASFASGDVASLGDSDEAARRAAASSSRNAERARRASSARVAYVRAAASAASAAAAYALALETSLARFASLAPSRVVSESAARSSARSSLPQSRKDPVSLPGSASNRDVRTVGGAPETSRLAVRSSASPSSSLASPASRRSVDSPSNVGSRGASSSSSPASPDRRSSAETGRRLDLRSATRAARAEAAAARAAASAARRSLSARAAAGAFSVGSSRATRAPNASFIARNTYTCAPASPEPHPRATSSRSAASSSSAHTPPLRSSRSVAAIPAPRCRTSASAPSAMRASSRSTSPSSSARGSAHVMHRRPGIVFTHRIRPSSCVGRSGVQGEWIDRERDFISGRETFGRSSVESGTSGDGGFSRAWEGGVRAVRLESGPIGGSSRPPGRSRRRGHVERGPRGGWPGGGRRVGHASI